MRLSSLRLADSYYHQEDSVTQKCLWRGVLVVALCVVLAAPARAQSGGKIGYGGPVVGPIVAVAAALVVLIIVVVHESTKKRRITGWVNSGEKGSTQGAQRSQSKEKKERFSFTKWLDWIPNARVLSRCSLFSLW